MSDGGDRTKALLRFAADLERLRVAVGLPSYATLKRRSPLLAPASLSDVLNGRTAPRMEFVLAFVGACLEHADAVGADVEVADRDLARWQARWRDLNDELRAFRGRSRKHDTSPLPTAVPWIMPMTAHALVGRAETFDQIDETTRGANQGSPAVVLLTGREGIGKTATAVAWAHRARHRFPHGQIYLDARGATSSPRSAQSVFAQMLAALGRSAPASADMLTLRHEAWRACAGRQMLIVFDNVSGPTDLATLLPWVAEPGSPPPMPGIVLALSRTDFAELSNQPGTSQIALGPLASHESALLLRRLGLHHSEAAVETVATACRHLPLALQLAADRLLTEPEEDVVEDLAARASAGDDPAQIVIDWSMEGRTAAERRALRILGTSPAADLDVLSASALLGLPPKKTRLLVSALVAPGLIERVEHRRYRVHDAVRTWAVTRGRAAAGQSDETHALGRLSQHLLAGADRADRLLLPQRNRAPVPIDPALSATLPRLVTADAADQWCSTQLALMVATAQAAAARPADPTIDTATAALPFALLGWFNKRKPWVAWRELCAPCLALAGRSGDLRLQADVAVSAGIAWRESGERAAAVDAFLRASNLYASIGERVGAAMALNNAATAVTSDDPSQAQQWLDHGLALLEEASPADAWRRGILQHNLAEALIALGEISRANECATAALECAQHADDRAGAAMALTTLAWGLLAAGDVEDAERALRDALASQQPEEMPYERSTTLLRLGELLSQTDRGKEARWFLEEAWSLRSALGAPDLDSVLSLLEALPVPR